MREKLFKTITLIILSIAIFFGGIGSLKASTAYISVKSSASTVVVGKTFNVTVTISSSVPLGSWEYTISYNSSLVKLVSGTSYIVDYGNGTKKSASYNYSFKAIGSGSPKISVKSYAAYDWSEKKMSVSLNSATIKTLTQAQLEATYSKNNYLKSLGVEGYSVSPAFNKNTLNYTVTVPSNIESVKITGSLEDSKASVTGLGKVAVSEGENKFNVVVTAENGSVKNYSLTITVIDPNPLNVTTTAGKNCTVVKRESLLTMPLNYTKVLTSINDVEVPAFYSEITDYTLVGLKDEEGNIDLYVYDKEKETFSLYREITLSQMKIYPLNILENEKFENYSLSKITINDYEVNAYKLKSTSEFAIIYGLNLEDGEKSYFLFDTKTNTITRYNDEEINLLNDKIKNYYNIILGLGIESIVLLIVLIIIIVKVSKRNNKKIKEKEKKEENNDIIKTEKKENKRKQEKK